MGRIIILEGTDAGGKTTLARILEKDYGYKYQHHGVPPDNINLFEYYGRHLVEAYESPHDHVFDRHWLGQLVYEPIVRKGPERISALPFMRLCRAWGVQIVLCVPTWPKVYEIWEKRMKDGTEWIKDQAILQKCYQRWLELGLHYGLQHYSYEKHNSVEVIRELVNADTAAILPPGVIGSPLAKYLFIGDQPNGSLDLPFFSNLFSSGYLSMCVENAGFEEDEIAFTNAFGPNGLVRDLDKVTSCLPYLEQMIYLGNRAWDTRIYLIGVTAFKAPHPSYWKRFRSKELTEYFRFLKGERQWK